MRKVSWETKYMKKIMIVEDHSMFRGLLRSILENEGFLCNEASHGQDACMQLQQHKVDIIITDHKMPYMDGLRLLEHLPQLYQDKLPVVILLTGSYTKRLDRLARTLGAAAVLKKPLHPPDLLTFLGQC